MHRFLGMDRFVSIKQAQVLTSKGFFQIWNDKRKAGLTREEAYNQTEELHRKIDINGENKYSEFCSFDRWAREQEAKRRLVMQ